MENVNNELVGHILTFLAILIPAILGGMGIRDILTRKDTNRTLEKAWDSIAPSVHKETVESIIALADSNANAVIAIVEKQNAQVADLLKQLVWIVNYMEDVTDGEDEALPVGDNAQG